MAHFQGTHDKGGLFIGIKIADTAYRTKKKEKLFVVIIEQVVWMSRLLFQLLGSLAALEKKQQVKSCMSHWLNSLLILKLTPQKKKHGANTRLLRRGKWDNRQTRNQEGEREAHSQNVHGPRKA